MRDGIFQEGARCRLFHLRDTQKPCRVLELDCFSSEAPRVRNQIEFRDGPSNWSSKFDTDLTRTLEILGQSWTYWLSGDKTH